MEILDEIARLLGSLAASRLLALGDD